MELPDFTVEHLKKLPLRAIVAFAARCAEGSSPSPNSPRATRRERASGRRRRRPPDGRRVSRGARPAPPPSRWSRRSTRAGRAAGAARAARSAAAAVAEAAHAAASAWHLIGSQEAEKDEPREERTAEARKFLGALADVTADLAALHAFTAAVEAYDAVGHHNEDYVAAALNDYDELLRLKLGRYPEPGDPIDPSPGGPLGPL